MGQIPPTPDEARRFLIARFKEEATDTSTQVFSRSMRRVLADDAMQDVSAYTALKQLSDADALRLYLAFLKESMKS